MTIVDERGRLFGRFNLIDAAVVFVLLVLVPLAYAAYRLFRPDPVRIESVEPSTAMVGQKLRVRLHGQHLAPYLRAQVGPAQPHVFLIESPMAGEFDLPELPAGTYSLTLYDEVQLVARMDNAITITPPPAGPSVRLQLVGAFFGLDEAGARSIVAGRKFPDQPGAAIEIVSAAAAREDVRRVRPVVGSEVIMSVPVPGSLQVPATVRAVCLPGGENQNCAVNGTIVSPGVTVPIPGGFSFVVDGIRADAPAAQVTARIEFVGRSEVIDLIRAGDADVSLGGEGQIVTVGNRQIRAGQISRQIGSAGVVETATTAERLASVEATVTLAADQTPAGLAYRSTALKPGALFVFETAKYAVRGAVVSVQRIAVEGAAK